MAPPRAAVRRRHPLDRFARAQKRAGDIGGEDALRAARRPSGSTRDCGSRMPALLTSAVSGPSRASHGLEQPHDLGFDAHVGLHGDGACPRPPSMPCDHRLGRGAVRSIVDADGIAALRREPRGRGADAAAAAGHQDRHGSFTSSLYGTIVPWSGTMRSTRRLRFLMFSQQIRRVRLHGRAGGEHVRLDENPLLGESTPSAACRRGDCPRCGRGSRSSRRSLSSSSSSTVSSFSGFGVLRERVRHDRVRPRGGILKERRAGLVRDDRQALRNRRADAAGMIEVMMAVDDVRQRLARPQLPALAMTASVRVSFCGASISIR